MKHNLSICIMKPQRGRRESCLNRERLREGEKVERGREEKQSLHVSSKNGLLFSLIKKRILD